LKALNVSTIHCDLIADDAVLQHLWQLMTEKYTPLINELLERLSQDPNLPTWLRFGKVSEASVDKICKELKSDPRFASQPGRFYTSATKQVVEIYQSWIALQQDLQRQIAGKDD